MAKDYQYYFSQLRRIEKHREEQAEKEIRKLYKNILKETRQFIAEEYYKLAEDGKLTFEILRSKSMDARFLEEIERQLGDLSIDVSKEIKKTAEEMYKLSYDGIKDAVAKGKDSKELQSFFQGIDSTAAQTAWSSVDNTIMDIALEKNHKSIIWDIKREVATALTVGDRFDTMADRIAKKLNGNYKKAIMISRTEIGRVRERGHLDSAKEINNALKNGSTNMRMVKKWVTMKDGKVRDTHSSMNGVTVGMDENFILPSGVKTQAPKQSGVASEDINCRCFVKYELRDDYGSGSAGEIGKPYTLKEQPDDELSHDQYAKMKKELEKASGRAFTDDEVKAMGDAVKIYTGGDYTDILAAGAGFKGLYAEAGGFLDEAAKAVAMKRYEQVEKYLANAPKYKGAVYRGLGFDLGGSYDDGAYDDLMTTLKKGNTVEMPSLTSWTANESFLNKLMIHRTGYDEEATAQARVKFVMAENKSGVNIRDYASLKDQDEVLFSKKAQFKVIDVEEKHTFDDLDDIEIIDVIVQMEEVL